MGFAVTQIALGIFDRNLVSEVKTETLKLIEHLAADARGALQQEAGSKVACIDQSGKGQRQP